ncbi:MAG TPA: PKD domain-containing protein [Methanoregula sp.]|nr:PKD domain-containing protein [Methanoregula sp.]
MIRSEREYGLSDAMGAIVLIAIVGMGIGLVGMFILSEPPPEKIPALSSDITTIGRTILITHNGGDSIAKSDMAIIVDGTDIKDSFQRTDTTPWTTWAVGDSLLYRVPDDQEMPQGVTIFFIGGSSARIIQSMGVPQSVTAGHYATGTVTPTTTITTPVTTPPIDPVIADFSANVVTGIAPYSVQFTDNSLNTPTSWSWNFGDGNTTNNNLQNPEHYYTAAGLYTVSLTATNAGGSGTATKVNFVEVKPAFVDVVVDENVFVYGTKFFFQGNTVIGPDATIIITGPLATADLGGNSHLWVNTIYIDGPVTLDSGSAGLGSPTNPGNISINGDLNLWGGDRDIYGDVYVAQDFKLKNCRIHGNVYVNGDLTLGWGEPVLDSDARIYYTGTFTHPGMSPAILSKCIQQATVPTYPIPELTMPPVKSADWYADRGYVSSGALTSNLKIFANSYSSTSWTSSASNVIIVAQNGDITLTGLGGSGVTGVFFAPNGRVTFNGGYFEGVVIARDGFYVTSGGTPVTFRNLDDYISDPADYPF